MLMILTQQSRASQQTVSCSLLAAHIPSWFCCHKQSIQARCKSDLGLEESSCLRKFVELPCCSTHMITLHMTMNNHEQTGCSSSSCDACMVPASLSAMHWFNERTPTCCPTMQSVSQHAVLVSVLPSSCMMAGVLRGMTTGLETMTGGGGLRRSHPSGACGRTGIDGMTGTGGTRGTGRPTGMTGLETGAGLAEKGPQC